MTTESIISKVWSFCTTLRKEHFTVIGQNGWVIDNALRRSEALRRSFLKKAFSGQLVAQDPTDEATAVLLERIWREREGVALGSRILISASQG